MPLGNSDWIKKCTLLVIKFSQALIELIRWESVVKALYIKAYNYKFYLP